jgi:hypothetical protein
MSFLLFLGMSVFSATGRRIGEAVASSSSVGVVPRLPSTSSSVAVVPRLPSRQFLSSEDVVLPGDESSDDSLPPVSVRATVAPQTLASLGTSSYNTRSKTTPATPARSAKDKGKAKALPADDLDVYMNDPDTIVVRTDGPGRARTRGARQASTSRSPAVSKIRRGEPTVPSPEISAAQIRTLSHGAAGAFPRPVSLHYQISLLYFLIPSFLFSTARGDVHELHRPSPPRLRFSRMGEKLYAVSNR